MQKDSSLAKVIYVYVSIIEVHGCGGGKSRSFIVDG